MYVIADLHVYTYIADDIGLLSNEFLQLNLPSIRVSQIRTTLSALAEATKLLISLRWMQ